MYMVLFCLELMWHVHYITVYIVCIFFSCSLLLLLAVLDFMLYY